MQLFWICCAQLPTGVCSGRHLALFPFHLSLLQDHSEYFTVSKKTAAPAIKAIFIQIPGPSNCFNLWKMQFQSILQVTFQQIELYKGESILQMKWKHPINFRSLKNCLLLCWRYLSLAKRFFYALVLCSCRCLFVSFVYAEMHQNHIKHHSRPIICMPVIHHISDTCPVNEKWFQGGAALWIPQPIIILLKLSRWNISLNNTGDVGSLKGNVVKLESL